MSFRYNREKEKNKTSHIQIYFKKSVHYYSYKIVIFTRIQKITINKHETKGKIAAPIVNLVTTKK